jgi:hypothetical protein
MAGLVGAMIALPYGYAVSNVASVVDGKGLRLAGGVTDSLLLAGTTVGVLLTVQVLTQTQDDNESLNIKKNPLLALGQTALVGGAYAGIKYYLGSPTSTVSDFAVGAAFTGLPVVLMSALDLQPV